MISRYTLNLLFYVLHKILQVFQKIDFKNFAERFNRTLLDKILIPVTK